jgi:phospholipase/lecithinase/hemolysin
MFSIQSFLDRLDPNLDLAVSPAPPVPPISPEVLNVPPTASFIYFDTLTPPAGGFSNIYAFGDSLSDAGNVSHLTLGVVPTAGIYSDGRFTNGAVWVQDLAQNLHVPVPGPSLTGGTDFAYGGAETGPTAVHPLNPTDLPSQVAQFAATVHNPSPNALYTVWAGSNDVLDVANSTETPAQQLATIQQAATNEAASIGALVADGARNFVVLGVPDLSKSPYEMARPLSDAASGTLAQAYNADLGAALQQIMAVSGAEIDFVNTFALVDAAIANPGADGLTNVTQPVWNGNLTNPHSGTFAATGAAQNGYLFFDNLHPTAAGHALLAGAVTQSLTGVA